MNSIFRFRGTTGLGATLLLLASLLLTGCKSSGSREYLPGKGWRSTQSQPAPARSGHAPEKPAVPAVSSAFHAG